MSNQIPEPAVHAMPEYPAALRPPISPGDPNKAILLHAGVVGVSWNTKEFRADASISLAWLPEPRIRIEIPAVPAVIDPTVKVFSLRLDDGTTISRVQVAGVSISSGPHGDRTHISGIIGEQIVGSEDERTAYVTFLVPNFTSLMGAHIKFADKFACARLVLVANRWKITLDEVDNQSQVQKTLNAESGYGVTHIGRLEHDNGALFNLNEALPILNALGWYMSFACGRWTGPCLPTGFAVDDKQVWQVWSRRRIAPYRHRQSWMDNGDNEHFEQPFPGFVKLWLDDSWEDVIRLAIHWYIEANAQAGSIEGSIVQTQTAFELLSSAVLVEKYGWLSQDGYEKVPAADRIRLLFLWAGIPVGIPPELADLERLAKADNWPDTATAMTMIRNTITHPTKKNREKYGKHSHEARRDVWTLGLWNLELCLLRLFDYGSSYGNRIKKIFGQVDQVPWAKSGIG